jgi:hypothetical protein
VCGRFLCAIVRGRRRQHYDRTQCARQAKLDRDRQYQREARRTPEGRVDPPPEPAEPEATDYLAGPDDPARARRLAWSDLFRRVWREDILRCGRYGGAMRLVAVIEDPAVIERILKHLGLWQRGPPRDRRLVLDPTACA